MGMRGWGLLFLSLKGYDLSGSGCALGEKSLLFQTWSIKSTAWKYLSQVCMLLLLHSAQVLLYGIFMWGLLGWLSSFVILCLCFTGFLLWLLLPGSWSYTEEQYLPLVQECCLETLSCSSIPFSPAYQCKTHKWPGIQPSVYVLGLLFPFMLH